MRKILKLMSIVFIIGLMWIVDIGGPISRFSTS